MYIVLTPVKYSLTCEWRRKEFEIGERHTCGAKHRKKIFVVHLHFFALQVQLVVFVSAFVIVSTVCLAFCLLLYILTVPSPVPSHL